MFSSLAITLSVIMGIVSVIWAVRHFRITSEAAGGVVLKPDYPVDPDAPAPKVSILVAAKDEEENIARCLESMLELEYENFEIIVCDDRSTDRTGEIIDSLAAKDARIKPVHIAQLPDGWKGKNHALHEGMKLAGGEYLLFMDADCHMTSTRALNVAMQAMRDNPVGLLCLLPHLEYKGFWEGMIQPMCSGLLMVWYDPKYVNNPRMKAAYANGAFMLFSRQAYQAVGGHQAVANSIQEDMQIARLIKHGKHGLRVIRCEDIYSVRMYTNLRNMVNGWTRIFYGCFDTYTKMFVTFFLTIFTSSLPPIITLLGVIMLCLGGTGPWVVATALAGLATFAELSVIYRYYTLLETPRGLALLYPVTSVILLIVLLRAILKHLTGSAVSWKGNLYKAK